VSLPDWADPLYDADEMRAVDAWACESGGVASLDLMERAGAGLATVAAELSRADDPIAIALGKGNNAGDGLVAARVLREGGRSVRLMAVTDPAELRGDARANLERLPGVGPEAFDPEGLGACSCLVDCLLGTGSSGTPREPVASAIAALNAAGRPIVACDVPSGVDASTGEVPADAVRAAATATFHGPKIGLAVDPGKDHAGAVRTLPIGVPRGAPDPGGAGLISARVIGLIPPRRRAGSKFASGVVAIAGGARGLTGAPSMVAMAAQRSGAGYVQVAVPRSAEAVTDARLLEAMTVALPDSDGAHVPDGVAQMLELSARAGAVVLGPGLGRSDGAGEFARRLAAELPGPLLIDADGLNAHAGDLERLAGRADATVLTPHAGELGRLLGVESAAVERRRLASAREAAARAGAIVVLKGDDSIVAAPDGRAAISPGASPALATAGTGDVLSGVIGTLLAKGLDPFAAAAAGVLAHARAGLLAAERLGNEHVIARDVIDALPAAFTSLR
jgi:NAD(P)H-hydrate epimerase